MLEDTFLEEDIWEYKSKRKRKPVHPDHCSDSIAKSVESSTDSKCHPKRNRNKKRTVDAEEKAKTPEASPGVTSSQTSIATSQNSDCGDGIQHSQDKETTPQKRSRTHKNKHVSPKIRPVYDGHCPNCQMPFSSLIGQTPRWHVFECLDSPAVSGQECPDGLLCNSTIPSHYKRYTHLLLAQSRASSGPMSSPVHRSDDNFNETNLGFHVSLEKSLPCQRQIENLSHVSTDASSLTQCLRKSQSPTDTRNKVSSWTNIQASQQTLQGTEFVFNNKPGGVVLPLAENSQSSSKYINVPFPENDQNSDEISYSPLESDEETYSPDERLDDSQQRLFFDESSSDSSLEEDNGITASFKKLPGPLLKNQGYRSRVTSLLTREKHSAGLYESHTLSNSPPLLSPNQSIVSCDDPAYFEDDFLFLPPASGEKPHSWSSQATKTKPDEPKFHSLQSHKEKQAAKESAVYNQTSSASLRPNMPDSFLSQGGDGLSLPPTQHKIKEGPGKNFHAKNNSNSSSLCRKSPGGMLDSRIAVSNEETHASECNATQPSGKVMKQMDIGVYFGLPPKRKEEKPQRANTVAGMDSNLDKNPREKRSGKLKRKADKSLSDLEWETENLKESPLELPSQSSQPPRKRRKRSGNLQEGTSSKRSDDHINKTASASETIDLNKDEDLTAPACGRQLRRNTGVSKSFNAGEFRKRTCPFYKKIPGTGFTVDAFQYGLIEGCTAYFLTHFHSDHYAGLSRKSALPIYCSEITANLLKSNLRIEEQYIHPLPVDTECIVNGVKVVLLDANHCPGAVMILFRLPNGQAILHTGDFRADPSMERSILAGLKIHTLYLDTTYCSPKYTFPSQQDVIQFAINTAFEAVTLNPRTLVVCGTYSIGKEKVFLAIADVLSSKVGMSQEKYKTLQCLNIPEMNSFITTDMSSSQVHLLSMMQISFKGLQNHLKKYAGKYDQILAFRPTGWTHSNDSVTLASIAPQTKGSISIYGIPYSEHSSYTEMKRFVQWLKPQKIIPTVNVGTLESRRTMENYFREWRAEAQY